MGTREPPGDGQGQGQGSHGRAWRYGRGWTSQPRRPADQNAGWTIFTYLLSGMAAYGLIGWLVGRATHLTALFPVGMLVGLVLAIVLVIFKYGRP